MKNNYFFLVSLIITFSVLHTGLSFSQWNMQNNPTMYNLTQIQMFDKNIGWIIGPECMLSTTDGGVNWSVQNSPILLPFRSLELLNSKKAFVIGGFQRQSGVKGAVIKTTDGGNNWILSHNSENYVYYDISFSDTLNGYFTNSNGDIYKTTDGGNNWELHTHIDGHYLSSIDFVSSQVGWGTGYNTVLKTVDGGINWTEVTLPQTAGIVVSFFVNENKGWIGGSGGQLLFTTDGGSTWDNQDIRSRQTIQSIYFIGERGWIGGDSGHVFHTLNGGKSWVRDATHFELLPIYSVFFTDTLQGWFTSGRNIYHTTTGGGTTSVNSNSKVLYSLLEQNYPNPFNNATRISYSISEQAIVSIRLYDIIGKEILTLCNQELPSGSYETFLNQEIASGIYFYILVVCPLNSLNKIYSLSKKLCVIR